MPESSGLTIRQYVRETIGLHVELAIADAHREQVRFSASSSAPEPHVTRGVAHDISTGGMGIICEHFVPRMCDGTVRVYSPTPSHTTADGTPVHEVAFEHAVKVRRVSMHSHEPTFSLGLAFRDPEPDIDVRVRELLTLVFWEQHRAEEAGEYDGSDDD